MTDRLEDLTKALIDLAGNRVDSENVAIEIEALIDKMIDEALVVYRQEKQ